MSGVSRAVACGQRVLPRGIAFFSIGGACLLPRGEIPVLSDAGPLKQRKNPKFAPGMDRKQRVAIHAADVYIAVSAGKGCMGPELRIWPSGLSVP